MTEINGNAVHLEDRNLDAIPHDVLLNCNEIYSLNLSGNPRIHLQNSLGRLKHLRQLVLAYCNLRAIPDEICELNELKELQLNDNDFSAGLNPAIGQLNELENLNLGACRLHSIHSLPDSIGNLKKLKELRLNDNDFEAGLNQVIGELHELKYLKLDRCGLFSLPDSFVNLKQLEHLGLNGNDFSFGLNPVIVQLNELKYLNLNDCRLHSLPDSIGHLKQLQKLRLTGNHFYDGINTAIGQLHELKYLSLDHCGLRSLPDSISNLKQLAHLGLTGNDFYDGLNPAIGQLHELKCLSLDNCGLRSLPDSIWNLKQLKELRLNDNDFSAGLNTAIGQLNELENLNLGACRLLSLPGSIVNLKQLEDLDIRHNNLAGGIQTVKQLKRLRRLNISGCHLSELPDWLGDLQMLEELDVSHNNLADRLHPVAKVKQLRKLNVSGCYLHSLPDWLTNLQMLEALDLSHNTFSDGLTATFEQLKHLKKLSLVNCMLNEIPEWFQHLHLLEELDIRDNKLLEGVNLAIGQLPGIKKFNDCRFDISKPPVQHGDQIYELDLSRHVFADGLNPVFRRLKGLKKLDLIGCELTCLPDWLGELTLLTDLNLSENNFSAGLSTSIGHLRQLKRFNLGQCGLSDLPDWIGNLKELVELSLYNNQFKTYPQCTIHLSNLRKLDLSLDVVFKRQHSGISKLPEKLADSKLSQLILDGNQITEPAKEIWEQGLRAIKSFFKEERYGTIMVCPDTINLIGDVNAGKTSIAQSLQKRSPQLADPEPRTQVMEQLPITFGRNDERPIIINDFGGHAIYHSVISIFLPSDGLVLLAYDISKEFEEQSLAVKKWLLSVIAKCKQIRLIVVGTHADKVLRRGGEYERKMRQCIEGVLNDAKIEVTHHKTILEGVLTEELEQDWIGMVKGKLKQLEELLKTLNDAKWSVLAISCSVSNNGLETLHELVAKMLRAPIKMPRRWLEIMRDITDATSDGPFLSWKQLQDIYKSRVNDVDGDGDLVVILRYLTSTSQIIWLEKHRTLREVVFNSPRKVIEVCKKVLHHERARIVQCNEHSDHEQAQQMQDSWTAQYPEDMKRYADGFVHLPFLKVLLPLDNEQVDIAVDFLKNFHLISEIKPDSNNRIFVIPSNLQQEEPRKKLENFEKQLIASNERLVMELSFVGSIIPKSFFETSVSSMLTAAYELKKEDLSIEAWYDGLLILYKDVSFAARRSDNKVVLAAFSERSSDVSLWSILRLVFERLHRYITSTWHGALPMCHIYCRSCQRNNNQITSSKTAELGRFEVPFEILSCVSLTEPRPKKCMECWEIIPQLLCLPTPQAGVGERASSPIDIDIREISGEKIEGNKIGSGSYGKVYQGKWQGKTVALKYLKNNSNQKQREDFLREGQHLSSLKHPNIISLYGICKRPDVILVMEYAHGGSLTKVIQEHHSVMKREDVFVDWSVQIASGLTHIHSKDFVHRDLTSDNILVMQLIESSTDLRKTRLKISDLGLLGVNYNTTKKASARSYNIDFMAPEVQVQKTFSRKSDVWSFGVILFWIINGELPDPPLKNEDIFEISENWNPKIQEILKYCLQSNHKERKEIKEIYDILMEMSLSARQPGADSLDDANDS